MKAIIHQRVVLCDLRFQLFLIVLTEKFRGRDITVCGKLLQNTIMQKKKFREIDSLVPSLDSKNVDFTEKMLIFSRGRVLSHFSTLWNVDIGLRKHSVEKQEIHSNTNFFFVKLIYSEVL